jgi:cytochrome b561
MLALAGGAAVGIGLGVYGLRLTKFEHTPEGMYYTPNAHLGIALSVLLVLRVGYRFAVAYFSPEAAAPPPAANLSPLTLAMFGTLAGYYVSYAVGLLRESG